MPDAFGEFTFQHESTKTKMTTRHTKVLIIGSGPAGYTAAIYASRAMLKPVLIAGLEQGGQLMITTDVENYQGYADPVQGPWMMEQMLKLGLLAHQETPFCKRALILHFLFSVS